MNNKKLVIGFVLLIVILAVWYMAVVPEVEKLSKDYEREFDLYYTFSENYNLGGELTPEQIANAFVKEKTLSNNRNTQVINSYYKAESLNGELIWETNHNFQINRKTREVTKRNNKTENGRYHIFPPGLKKENYTLWTLGSNNNFKAEFVDVKTIKGLEVYTFKYTDVPTNDTESFGWLDLVPESFNAGSIQTVIFTVEPVTGILIDFDEKGSSNYQDKQTGEKIQDIQTWTAKFTDDTITTQIIKAQNEKFKILLIKTIIPILLAISIITITLFLPIRKERDEK